MHISCVWHLVIKCGFHIKTMKWRICSLLWVSPSEPDNALLFLVVTRMSVTLLNGIVMTWDFKLDWFISSHEQWIVWLCLKTLLETHPQRISTSLHFYGFFTIFQVCLGLVYCSFTVVVPFHCSSQPRFRQQHETSPKKKLWEQQMKWATSWRT